MHEVALDGYEVLLMHHENGTAVLMKKKSAFEYLLLKASTLTQIAFRLSASFTCNRVTFDREDLNFDSSKRLACTLSMGDFSHIDTVSDQTAKGQCNNNRVSAFFGGS